MHVPPPPTERRGFPWWAWMLIVSVPTLGCGMMMVGLSQAAALLDGLEGTAWDETEAWPEYAANYAAICLDDFHRDTGRYPTAEEGLIALVEKPPATPKWNGPYAYDWFEDEWGNKLEYEPLPTGYRITSYGMDGKPGGKGDDADFLVERRSD